MVLVWLKNVGSQKHMVGSVKNKVGSRL